jgi:hypothetical protein
MTTYNVANLPIASLFPVASTETFSNAGIQLRKFAQEVEDSWNASKARKYQQQERVAELQSYVASLVKDQVVTPEVALLALSAWEDLQESFGERIPVPDAGATADGGILYSWNNDEHHFELEILEQRQATFFYLNYLSDEMWETQYAIGGLLPKEVQVGLKSFLQL